MKKSRSRSWVEPPGLHENLELKLDQEWVKGREVWEKSGFSNLMERLEALKQCYYYCTQIFITCARASSTFVIDLFASIVNALDDFIRLTFCWQKKNSRLFCHRIWSVVKQIKKPLRKGWSFFLDSVSLATTKAFKNCTHSVKKDVGVVAVDLMWFLNVFNMLLISYINWVSDCEL